MANETILTVVGNLTDDPSLRYTPNGVAVANFVVASTPRIFDRQANEFKDGETLFLRCSAWRELGENVAESCARGMRVIVQGRLKTRSFETKEGEKRSVTELDADEVGPSLRRATAQVAKNQPAGGYVGHPQGGGFGGQQQSVPPQQSQQSQPGPVPGQEHQPANNAGGDPWASQDQQIPWGNSEPPF